MMPSRVTTKSDKGSGGMGNSTEEKSNENERSASTTSAGDSKRPRPASAAATVTKAEESDRLEQRRAYNRMNAARARKRTKDQVVDLVSKAEINANRIAALERENTALLEEVGSLSAENQRLRDVIQHHLQSPLLGSPLAAKPTPLDSSTLVAQHNDVLRGLGAETAASYGEMLRGTSWLGHNNSSHPLLGMQQSDTMRLLLSSSAGDAWGQQMGQQHDNDPLLAALLLQQQSNSGRSTVSMRSAPLGDVRNDLGVSLQSQLMRDMQQQVQQQQAVRALAADAEGRQNQSWLQALLDASNSNEHPRTQPPESGRFPPSPSA